jgi:IclR family acetate operon transcriptional repressor
MATSGARPDRTVSRAEPTPPQYPIESVDNALRLLLLFQERRSIRLTDASSYLEVASSTAHRLLSMLQWRGFVRQNAETRAYEPGPALSSIAFAILRKVDARERARPVLHSLHEKFDETVHFVRLEGANVNFIDAIESTRALRVGARTGRLLPAHATSTGKAMLSLLTVTQLHALYPGEHLEQLTSRTIATRTELERALQTVRRRGYAVSDQEGEEGVTSVAVPVATETETLYAINVALPAQRMTKALSKEIADCLVEAAYELRTLLI